MYMLYVFLERTVVASKLTVSLNTNNLSDTTLFQSNYHETSKGDKTQSIRMKVKHNGIDHKVNEV